LERGVRRRPYVDTVDVVARALQLLETDRLEFHNAAKRARGTDERAPRDNFVGREEDVEILGRSLRSKARRLTVTGPAALEKSRLSIEVAGLWLPTFEDGVWLVEAVQFDDLRPLIHESAA
jgi:hypothetical protein